MPLPGTQTCGAPRLLLSLPPMAEPPQKTLPTLTPKAEAEQLARREREAAALRENLRRRKAQARAKTSPPAEPDPR